MSDRLINLAIGSLILALSAACSSMESEPKPKKNTSVTQPATPGSQPYRHQIHLFVSIQPTNPIAYQFPIETNAPITVTVIFKSATAGTGNVFATVPWDVYSQKVGQITGQVGIRLNLELIARKPPSVPGLTDQAAGTGAITVSTTETRGGTTTTTSTQINVEIMDTTPYP